MKKCEMELKPIPSYIKIEGCELYVIDSGQQITCNYCGNKRYPDVVVSATKSDDVIILLYFPSQLLWSRPAST